MNQTIEAARRIALEGRKAAATGALDDALGSYERALKPLAEDDPIPLRADLIRWSGGIYFQLGRTTEAERCFRNGLEQAERAGYPAGSAHALNCLGALAQRMGDMEEAELRYAEAGARAVHANERRLLAMVEHNRGIVANIRADYDRALAHYLESLRVLEELGDEPQCAGVLNDLGKLFNALGRHDEAGLALDRAMKLARRCGNEAVQGVIELNRAERAAALGDWGGARFSAERSVTLAERTGAGVRRAEALRALARVQRSEGSVAEAAEGLSLAHGLAQQADDALLCAEILRDLGELSRVEGDLQRTRELWAASLQGFQRLGARREAEEMLTSLQRVAA